MSEREIILIDEPIPLKKARKGGAANLMLTALLVEAGRMLDEGFQQDAIEAAAVKTFGMEEGFLAWLERIGIEKARAMMELLSLGSGEEDPFAARFDNFFSPPKCLLNWKPLGDKNAAVEQKAEGSDGEEMEDFMLLDLLGRRFKGVLFMTAVDLVEAEVLGLGDVESLCKTAFGWAEGPFAMMNRIGVEESLKIVTQKMELSHRREINFPIPRLLLDQVRLQKPWMLPS